MIKTVKFAIIKWIMENKGKFIVFEGIDGSGKSTQLKRLAAYLEERGVPNVVTCEPTYSDIGSLLRACLTGVKDADERAIAALFAADRLDHIFNKENGIQKLLNDGITVLCDRYYLSSFAYNGGFVPQEWVIKLNEIAMQQMRPDLTVYIELSPEACAQRLKKRASVERYESLDKQIAIHERYLALFERFGGQENIAIVKSEQEKEATQANIRKTVDKLFGF